MRTPLAIILFDGPRNADAVPARFVLSEHDLRGRSFNTVIWLRPPTDRERDAACARMKIHPQWYEYFARTGHRRPGDFGPSMDASQRDFSWDLFLLQYLTDQQLREVITRATALLLNHHGP